MKRMNIKIFCLALCTSLMMSGCTPSGGDESDVTAENNAETSAENVTGTAETSLSVSGTETKKAETGTAAVSGTEVSENVSGTAKVSDTAKSTEKAKVSETTRVPGPPAETGEPAVVPHEGGKPDTYADPGEYGYSDDELCTMARGYYGSRTNHSPEFVEVEGETDGKVNIHLYDLFDGHTSTAAWYYIDRMTGKGTDFLENEINLTAPPAEMWNPDVPQRSKIEGDKRCAVLYIGYIDSDIETYISRNVAYQEMVHQDFNEVNYTWLADMPKENYAETPGGNELYLIIPRDKEANVRVSLFDLSREQLIGNVYSSYRGAPFLLRCNVSEIRPDAEIFITDNSGEYPGFSVSLSGKDGSLCESDSYTRLNEYTEGPAG